MAFFSNGTEGEIFEERFCRRCVHRPRTDEDGEAEDCAVWLLHLAHNSEQLKDPTWKAALDALITPGMPDEQRCRMFVPVPETQP